MYLLSMYMIITKSFITHTKIIIMKKDAVKFGQSSEKKLGIKYIF